MKGPAEILPYYIIPSGMSQVQDVPVKNVFDIMFKDDYVQRFCGGVKQFFSFGRKLPTRITGKEYRLYKRLVKLVFGVVKDGELRI